MSSSRSNEERNIIMNRFNLQQERYRKRLQEIDEEEAEDNKLMEMLMLVHTGQIERVPEPKEVLSRRYTYRGREFYHQKLMHDYFLPNCVYSDQDFQRRFRMPRHLVKKIIEELCRVEPKFNYQFDALNIRGHSPEQKITSALRILGYGNPADANDEYIRMGKTTSFTYLSLFCEVIINHFGPTFLRKPNNEDLRQILRQNEERGFPGMLGSLDCMHWEWQGCPVYWAGQYKGHYPKPTVILEAAASYDCWIWHAFFGLPGSQNDINVLHKSPLFEDLKYGIAPSVRFMINGHQYTHGYYLADGIYPRWSTLVQCYRQPPTGAFGLSYRYFNDAQMALRKDVERAFGILKRKFAIICGPYRGLSRREMHKTMLTCIILHNMIIQETRRDSDWTNYDDEDLRPDVQPHRGVPARDYGQMTNYIQNLDLYEQLRDDLRLNLWAEHGR